MLSFLCSQINVLNACLPSQPSSAFLLLEWGVQGVSHIPTLFSDYIYRALYNDTQGFPDPIALLIAYLDDVLSYSGLSTLRREAYTQLLRELQQYRLAEDEADPAYTPLSEIDLLSACDHYYLNDRIFSRLKHHNFKIKISKLSMFLEEAETLGVIINKHGLTIDPKRKDKILVAKIPSSVKEMQAFCGFLSSICLYTNNQISHHHGILSELTSAKNLSCAQRDIGSLSRKSRPCSPRSPSS